MEPATARSHRSISSRATAQAVYSRRTPRLAASSAWNVSDSCRKRRNDSTRSHSPEPSGVRTRSSQPRTSAANPPPPRSEPTTTSAIPGQPQRFDGVATGEREDGAEHHHQRTDAPAPWSCVDRPAASHRPLPRAQVSSSRVDQAPAGRERGVVGAELHLLPSAERGGQRPGERALLHQPDVAPVLLDEVDGAVDGGLDEPGHLVLRPHLLGVEQPALGGRELGRGRELGGGHLLQLALVEPHLAGRAAPAGPRRVGDAAGADPLATGAPHQLRGPERGPEPRGHGRQRRQREARSPDRAARRRAAPAGRASRRATRRAGRRDGHALAGVEVLHARAPGGRAPPGAGCSRRVAPVPPVLQLPPSNRQGATTWISARPIGTSQAVPTASHSSVSSPSGSSSLRGRA